MVERTPALARELCRIGRLLSAIAEPESPSEVFWDTERVNQYCYGPGAEPPAFDPVAHARRAFELNDGELDAVLVALAAEVSPEHALLLGHLEPTAAAGRPSVALVASIADASQRGFAARLANRPVVRDGLLVLHGDGPLMSRTLRVPDPMIDRLLAREAPTMTGRDDQPELDELALAPGLRASIERWLAHARRGQAQTLVVCGSAGTGRATLVRAVAAQLRVPLVRIDWTEEPLELALQRARRDARWYGAAALLCCERLPSGREWQVLAAGLPNAAAFCAVTLPPSEGQDAVRAAGLGLRLDLGVLPPAEQARLWQHQARASGGLDAAAAGQLGRRYRFSPAESAIAIRNALRRDGAPVTLSSVTRACRELKARALGPFVDILDQPYRDADLVLPKAIREQLSQLLAWARNEATVLEDWGFGETITRAPGIRALMAGPPGTGKTMAAQVIAAELDLDLYRIDLARVVSKYVGETEKNLALAFDTAATAGAILFFDEAEALFGQRSAVKVAHDRHANIEVAYLLQRLEAHHGFAILASNRPGDMDPAFLRRFDFRLFFTRPGAAERLALWRRMLPRATPCQTELGLAQLAERVPLTGAEIRNAALHGAYLAAAEGIELGPRHLRAAICHELRKVGRVVRPEVWDMLTSEREP